MPKREREFVVDVGASVHLMSKADLTPDEQETINFKEHHNT